MSDEVRTRSVSAPADPGELAAGPDGSQAVKAPSEPPPSHPSASQRPPSQPPQAPSLPPASSLSPPSRPTDSERPTNPLPREPVTNLEARLGGGSSVELPVAKVSERPPPPSQRAARLAAGASLAPARAGRSITPLPIS